MTEDHGCVPFVVVIVTSFSPHSWPIIGFVIRVTRRLSLVRYIGQNCFVDLFFVCFPFFCCPLYIACPSMLRLLLTLLVSNVVKTSFCCKIQIFTGDIQGHDTLQNYFIVTHSRINIYQHWCGFSDYNKHQYQDYQAGETLED